MQFDRRESPIAAQDCAPASEIAAPLDELTAISWDRISGLGRVETTDFVHPAWLPELCSNPYADYDPGLVSQGLTIVEKAGQGASGTVFIAWDELSGSFIALKGIPEAIAPRDEARLAAAILRESEMTSHLRHPNIVSSLGIVSGDRGPYIRMEAEVHLDFSSARARIVRNNDLAALIKNVHTRSGGDPESLRPLLQSFLAICDASAFLHEHGVAHGDIKPTNILFSGNGRPLLADFGLARFLSGPGGTFEPMPEGFAGTVGYCAPEIIAHGKTGQIDCRAEVYSLGAVLYNLLTARTPFDELSGSSVARLFAAVTRDPLPVSEFNSRIPKSWEGACNKALSRERQDRYQTVQAFKEDLIHALF